jgi:nucleoside 2-deoxyribosyltransferase
MCETFRTLSVESTVEEKKIYLAGPLFTDAERAWHKSAKAEMTAAGFDVVWPGELLTRRRIEEAGGDAPALIFKTCRDALDSCDLVVALLDGTQVDDGTAWEIGYAYAGGKPVYGIRTDTRLAGDTGFSRVNGMIEGCLAGLGKKTAEVIAAMSGGTKGNGDAQ